MPCSGLKQHNPPYISILILSVCQSVSAQIFSGTSDRKIGQKTKIGTHVFTIKFSNVGKQIGMKNLESGSIFTKMAFFHKNDFLKIIPHMFVNVYNMTYTFYMPFKCLQNGIC